MFILLLRVLIASSPIAQEIGVHSGTGLFGPESRANAAIGRVFQTILRNVGGEMLR